MNNEKKQILRRLAIFLILSFVPFWILIPVLWAVFKEPIFVSEKENVKAIVYVVSVFGMMIPSAANLLTRLLTKEGFADSYLGISFQGKMGFYLASLLVKPMEGILCLILFWLIFLGGQTFRESFPYMNVQGVSTLLLQFSFSVIIFFPAFGEEWGWRGYMMPKLLKLMPKSAAIVVGGVIWGLWHAPLTIAGHNFGVDYPGYPFTGILLMCLFSVLMNCFLTLVTEKTHSIYPASFIHMLNNNLGLGVLLTIFGSTASQTRFQELGLIEAFFLLSGVCAVTACISFLLFLKKGNKSVNQK